MLAITSIYAADTEHLEVFKDANIFIANILLRDLVLIFFSELGKYNAKRQILFIKK